MRHALRSLLKSPGFTLVALLTLALCIGVNTTAFSVLNTLLLHRAPYPAADQLVRLYRTAPQSTGRGFLFHAPANYIDYRSQNDVFSQLAAFQFSNFSFSAPEEPPDRLRGLLVTPDFFPLLGVTAILGRTFTEEEDRPGNHGVTIISHGMWLQRFGGDPGVIGRTIRINAEQVTVIGVMPPTFDDPMIWGEVAAWRPLALNDRARQDRDNNTVNLVARLKRGVTLEQAQAGINTITARLEQAYPRDNARTGVRLFSLSSSAQDDLGRRVTWLVMGLAGLVLLIGCANLANLQLARNLARGREHAIRAALGASRSRLVTAVLTESTLLALAGGALGLLLALWTTELVSRFFVLGDLSGVAIPLDQRVLGFTLAVSLVTSAGFGLLPALMTSRPEFSAALKQAGRGMTANRSQHRIRRGLIIVEVALALALLAGATFFARGLQRFTQRDPGWRPDGMLSAYLSLRGERFATPAARAAFARTLQEQLTALPGVERVTIGSSLPTFGFNNTNSFVVEDQPEPAPGLVPEAAAADVMPGYFETLGMRLLQGRDFAPTDRADSPTVVIVNEAMARALWPGENPIGKRIGSAMPFMSNLREVVGVVSNTRPAARFGVADDRFQMYRPFAQRPQSGVVIALRTYQAPETLISELRRVVASLDRDQPLFQIGTVRQEIGRGLASMGVAAWTLGAFALLGLILAAVGIYGVVSNSVVQRTNEIGIRMALGAQMRDIFRLVIGSGLRLTLVGTLLGLGGALAIARMLHAMAPDLAATDPFLTALVALVLIAVALFACWLPARRAARVNPVIALRAE